MQKERYLCKPINNNQKKEKRRRRYLCNHKQKKKKKKKKMQAIENWKLASIIIILESYRVFFSIHNPYPFILKYINFDKHKAKMAKRKGIELSQTDPILSHSRLVWRDRTASVLSPKTSPNLYTTISNNTNRAPSYTLPIGSNGLDFTTSPSSSSAIVCAGT